MPYTMQFPAYRIGGRVELCLIRGYALSEVYLKRGSTVHIDGTHHINIPSERLQ